MIDKTLQSQLTNPQTAREREIAALGPWFHNLHLPGGTQTAPNHPLGDFPAFKWRQIAPHLPADLTGWNVLDVGCNAGFYSFELARRGARVTGIDLDPHYLRQAAWAAAQLGLAERIQWREIQIYDLAHSGETYDLIWFMGVLYHLRYPLLGLDILSRKVRRLLLLQTLTLPGEEVAPSLHDLGLADRERLTQPDWPRMAFIEQRLEDDPTNWWVPNHACIEALLRASGLRVIARPGHEMYLCEPAPDAAKLHEENDAELRAATGQPWLPPSA